MNDPCGPMYDAQRDTYHIFYQAFPQHVNFGNTSWGHATSRDLITWADVNGWRGRDFVALEPGASFGLDWLGAFSGGAFPGNLHGSASDGNLTIFYTGSRSSPDFWRKPYAPGSETQNAATSADGGRTWQKWRGNPILDGAGPGGWNVTGMRDPIPARIPALARVLGDAEDTFYITIGSGIRGVGPRAPLWKAPGDDLTAWTFQGSLFELPLNTTWGGVDRTGSFGGNFEMATLYPLVEREESGGDGATLHWVYTVGAEGFPSPGHDLAHWSLFALGAVSRRANASAAFDMRAAGVVDWGNGYAVNTFWDEKAGRRVAWGWADEDFNGYGVSQNGYQGALLLPRELYVRKWRGVVAPTEGPPERSAEVWEREDGEDGGGRHETYTVTTLAQRPLPDVVAGIQGRENAVGDIAVGGGGGQEEVEEEEERRIDGLNSSAYHLQATLASWPAAAAADGQVGFKLRASPADDEYTTVFWTPFNNTLVLNRARSSLIANFTQSSFNAYLEPFLFPAAADSASSDTNTDDVVPEPLVFDIFVDGSLLEIFVNDRLSLSSRVYPSRADALGAAVVSTAGAAVFENVTFWDGMRDVWPQRPANSSGELHVDPYYETHVTVENEWVDVGVQVYDGY
ncbi:hypothetical protein SLS58_011279 [Diplodia intermedia]|uniref:Glycoside hydrolase family 32 protein n=1 Tax=Diplodia intermedia TaxID=856260 RepID=A0ABR3SZZ8_9PEZI